MFNLKHAFFQPKDAITVKAGTASLPTNPRGVVQKIATRILEKWDNKTTAPRISTTSIDTSSILRQNLRFVNLNRGDQSKLRGVPVERSSEDTFSDAQHGTAPQKEGGMSRTKSDWYNFESDAGFSNWEGRSPLTNETNALLARVQNSLARKVNAIKTQHPEIAKKLLEGSELTVQEMKLVTGAIQINRTGQPFEK